MQSQILNLILLWKSCKVVPLECYVNMVTHMANVALDSSVPCPSKVFLAAKFSVPSVQQLIKMLSSENLLLIYFLHSASFPGLKKEYRRVQASFFLLSKYLLIYHSFFFFFSTTQWIVEVLSQTPVESSPLQTTPINTPKTGHASGSSALQ